MPIVASKQHWVEFPALPLLIRAFTLTHTHPPNPIEPPPNNTIVFISHFKELPLVENVTRHESLFRPLVAEEDMPFKTLCEVSQRQELGAQGALDE